MPALENLSPAERVAARVVEGVLLVLAAVAFLYFLHVGIDWMRS